MKRDYDTSIYKGVTGKEPKTTAKTRAQIIEEQMEGTYNPNKTNDVLKRGYFIEKEDK